MTRQTDHAWAAGFIDGEGHIRLWHSVGRGQFHTALIASQKDLAPLHRLQVLYGGRVKTRRRLDNRHPVSDWSLTGRNNLISALEAVRPYLVVKAPQADVLLEYLYGTESGHPSPLVVAERIRREALAARMADLNRRGREAVA